MMHFKDFRNVSTPASKHEQGFGTTEMLLSLAAGGLIIIGSGTALQSMQNVIQTSGSRATLRQNTSNGLQLLRSEVTKSDHLLVFESDDRSGEDTDLSNYAGNDSAISVCKNSSSEVFKPVFGLRNSRQLGQLPVIYGIGLNSNGLRYALYRCGPAIAEDGSYDVSNIYVSTLIDDIGVMPQKTCIDDEMHLAYCDEPVEITKKIGDEEFLKTIQEIHVDTINRPGFGYQIADSSSSPSRTYREPAFRFSTDEDRRILSFVAPNPDYLDDEQQVIPSFIQMSTGLKSLSMQKLQFTAYARADKRIAKEVNGVIVLDGLFFRGELSNNVRFLLDGSGSMKSCIYQSPTPVYVVSRRGWRGWSGRARATYPCIVNRMQALKAELRTLLQELHETAPNTKIGLESFSVDGNYNHKSWNGQDMSRIGDEAVLDSVLAFIDTIDETRGSYTNPWPGLITALEDNTADTLFFLSDGKPTQDPSFGDGTVGNDFEGTAEDLQGMNEARSSQISVHSIALGVESEWMEELSRLSGGHYNYVDIEDVSSLQEADS